MKANTDVVVNAMAAIATIVIVIIFQFFIQFTSTNPMGCGWYSSWLKQN